MKTWRNWKEIFFFSPAIRFGSLFSPLTIDTFDILRRASSSSSLKEFKRSREKENFPLNNIYIFINSLLHFTPLEIVCVYFNAIVCLFHPRQVSASSFASICYFSFLFDFSLPSDGGIIDWEMKNKWAEKYIKRIQISTCLTVVCMQIFVLCCNFFFPPPCWNEDRECSEYSIRSAYCIRDETVASSNHCKQFSALHLKCNLRFRIATKTTNSSRSPFLPAHPPPHSIINHERTRACVKSKPAVFVCTDFLLQ